jgi:hypothetical protein
MAEENIRTRLSLIVMHHFGGYTAVLKADRKWQAEGASEEEACRNLIDSLLDKYQELKNRPDSQLSEAEENLKNIIEAATKRST